MHFKKVKKTLGEMSRTKRPEGKAEEDHDFCPASFYVSEGELEKKM